MHRRATLTAATTAVLLAAAAPALAAPPLPTGPADGAVSSTLRPVFAWSPGTSGVPVDHYEVYAEVGGASLQVASAPAAATSARAAVDLPDDGTYRWFVRLVNANGGTASTPPDARTSVVVATPPGAPAVTEVPADAPGDRAFAWAGDRVGSRWTVLDDGGQPVRSGDAPAASGRAEIAGLGDGAYVFRVVQTNAAGQEGAAAARPFVVEAPAPAPAAATAPEAVTEVASRPARARPAARATAWRRRTERLRPAAGAVVATRRPVLRWTAGPRGTSAYNVQVFEVAGTRLRKVRSRYPAGTRLALTPRDALRPGRCYVWRVWPYTGRTYTAAPLAVSDFCVRAEGAVR